MSIVEKMYFPDNSFARMVAIKKGTSFIMKFPFLFRIEKFGLLVSSFFFDSSFLTSKSAQVVQFSATNFTYLVHFDAIDSR